MFLFHWIVLSSTICFITLVIGLFVSRHMNGESRQRFIDEILFFAGLSGLLIAVAVHFTWWALWIFVPMLVSIKGVWLSHRKPSP
jgi:fatty acid desaturase